jgi:hypothetical protein
MLKDVRVKVSKKISSHEKTYVSCDEIIGFNRGYFFL